MVANLTQVGDAIGNINATFNTTNTSGILTTAIQQNNINSNDWIGIIIFFVMCASVFFLMYERKNDFALFDRFNVLFVPIVVFIDMGIYLVIWEILGSVKVFFFVFTIFFVFATISQFRKDALSVEGI